MVNPAVSGPDLPPRYERIAALGKGGGGEVWAVRDRTTGRTVALKALGEKGSEREVQALVREAVALSGLEGLGVPRVLRFGRLTRSGRPFLVRELVEGKSLADLLEEGATAKVCMEAIARACDQLTVLHRAGLLHGDVKPANIIVGADGAATLVDLGLVAPFRETGARPEGLTPRYAAPELFKGAPLHVRAEIFALGATLLDFLEQKAIQVRPAMRTALERVAERATAEEPSARFPSADEMASELRRAAELPSPERLPGTDASWPIVGVEPTVAALLARISELRRGDELLLVGPKGSGKSALLRRAAWSLGVDGRAVAWVEAAMAADVKAALQTELEAHRVLTNVAVFVDDADRLDRAAVSVLVEAKKAGARLVLAGQTADAMSALAKGDADTFVVPPLEARDAGELVRRAIPSLSEALTLHVVARANLWPGPLRGIVRRLAGHTLVGAADVDRLLDGDGSNTVNSIPGDNALAHAGKLLDQGRYDEAAVALLALDGDLSLAPSIARARLLLGRGDPSGAKAELSRVADAAETDASGPLGRTWALSSARADLRLGDYEGAVRFAKTALAGPSQPSIEGEAMAVAGLAESYMGKHEAARTTLDQAVERAKGAGDRRVESVALASLAIALQRNERHVEARATYESALSAAEAAGDAGSIATIRLNLAALAQGQGDFAGALAHLEAAVDMGRRAGRSSTMEQALLNLANLDLYLGRYARARSNIEALSAARSELPPAAQAQLLGLEADLASRTGDSAGASRLYGSCAQAYEGLGRGVDAAEARLEAALLAARAPQADVAMLSAELKKAMSALGGAPSHKSMIELLRGAIAMHRGDERGAAEALDHALSSARESGQKEWIWRALESRARFSIESGQLVAARRETEEALGVLEEIALRLPRDLREVFWDDPRRRQLRAGSASGSGPLTPPIALPAPARAERRIGTAGTPVETLAAGAFGASDDRLARILEINRDLAAEHDLARLLDRVTDHAIALVRAERGFVILAGEGGELNVHTSRDRAGDDPHARFSRNIAEKVISSGDAVVSLSARDDDRMAGYVSVHQLMLQSVACVPIRSPSGNAIGALYLETRLRPGAQFSEELPTIRAFADQVAMAIENARLVTESAKRASDLELANAELLEARAKLEELLGERTAELVEVRRDLRGARAVLRSHFGYHGLVGTSSAMRKVYALIDRIKDTDVPVLVTGESGTGKEIVARAIHTAGPRGKGPFTGINCGAIPEHLLESELFGHVRGAFTGADRDRKGLFRESETGTLLLDEIGEMPKRMQAGLLRVLQEKVVRPIGGTREQAVDVRLIAATNRDLANMVAQGTFREDLFYRLHVVEVALPPLRARLEDLPILIDHFLGIFAARYRREKKAVSREALRKLSQYGWPGNVRQLTNVLLNAWVMSDRPELLPDDFDLPGMARSVPPPAQEVEATAPRTPSKTPSTEEPRSSSKRGGLESPSPPRAAPPPAGGEGRDAPPRLAGPSAPRDEAEDEWAAHRDEERERIVDALTRCNWNRVKAAKLVGLPRRTFYRRLKEYGIQ